MLEAEIMGQIRWSRADTGAAAGVHSDQRVAFHASPLRGSLRWVDVTSWTGLPSTALNETKAARSRRFQLSSASACRINYTRKGRNVGGILLYMNSPSIVSFANPL
jgi:hypothetical protein